MNKRLVVFGFLIFIVTSCAVKQSTIVKSNSMTIKDDQFNRLKKVLHRYVDNQQLAGIQTAIIQNDTIIHFDSYGYADLENEIPLDEGSIFRIFSMTKPITSVALMQLYEQGKFQLDDPVSQYIPEFEHMSVYDDSNAVVAAKNKIKIIDLLRHSSGISYGRSPNENLNTLYTEAKLGRSKDLKSFIKTISELPLLFEPGTDYEYGYSTDICGYLIEVLSGQPLDAYLKEHLFVPLQMNDTHFQLPEEKVQYLTVGYRVSEEGELLIADIPEESMFTKDVTFFKGGGGLVSTTNDYLNFCKMLLHRGTLFNTQIIRSETLDIMLKDHLEPIRAHTSQLRIISGETGFGLGFSIAEQKDGRIVYGWGGAVGTYYRVDPDRNLAYIMMIQLSPYQQLNLGETFQQLVNKALKL